MIKSCSLHPQNQNVPRGMKNRSQLCREEKAMPPEIAYVARSRKHEIIRSPPYRLFVEKAGRDRFCRLSLVKEWKIQSRNGLETWYVQLPPSVIVTFLSISCVVLTLTNTSLLANDIVVIVKFRGCWSSSHNGACALFDGTVLIMNSG